MAQIDVDAQAMLSEFDVRRGFEYLQEDPSDDAKLHLVRAVLMAYEAGRIEMPKGRSVGRVGDMAPATESHMRGMLDSDNDVCVSILDGKRMAGIEFCNGFNGGGKSPQTRKALLALMVAMECDNVDAPYAQHPPVVITAA